MIVMLREHDYDDSLISILIFCPSTRRRYIERELEKKKWLEMKNIVGGGDLSLGMLRIKKKDG